MPQRLKTRCRFPGCGRATHGRYCDEHTSAAAQMLAVRRGSAAQRGYDTQWERVAVQRRQMDCYLCQACLKRGMLTPSSIVDHIIPIDVRPDWRLEIGNTQVLCRTCHAVKTDEDKRKYGLRGTMTSERGAAMRLERTPRDDDTVA